MYRTCISCHGRLGDNEEVEAFPVGERLAFDPERGRLWVVCTRCRRWNLSPLEERWEAIEECDRLFRGTGLRHSTGNVGIARRPSGLDLVRIGRAPRSEIAAWRYGGLTGVRSTGGQMLRLGLGLAADRLMGLIPRYRPRYEALTWLRIHAHGERPIDVVPLDGERRAVLRYRHLEGACLLRPDRGEPWRLVVQHEAGAVSLSGSEGLRRARRLLSAVNGTGATGEQVRAAVRKVEDAADPDGYFARVAALALRTSWGRHPDARRDAPVLPVDVSVAETLALHLTSRSFWGRGAIGSELRTPLPRLPLVDRLALEMAASEDVERQALETELAALEAEWREAEVIAEIADRMFDDVLPPGALTLAASGQLRRLASLLFPVPGGAALQRRGG